MKPVQNWVKSEASQLSRSFVITTQKIGYLGEANEIRLRNWIPSFSFSSVDTSTCQQAPRLLPSAVLS